MLGAAAAGLKPVAVLSYVVSELRPNLKYIQSLFTLVLKYIITDTMDLKVLINSIKIKSNKFGSYIGCNKMFNPYS